MSQEENPDFYSYLLPESQEQTVAQEFISLSNFYMFTLTFYQIEGEDLAVGQETDGWCKIGRVMRMERLLVRGDPECFHS